MPLFWSDSSFDSCHVSHEPTAFVDYVSKVKRISEITESFTPNGGLGGMSTNTVEATSITNPKFMCTVPLPSGGDSCGCSASVSLGGTEIPATRISEAVAKAYADGSSGAGQITGIPVDLRNLSSSNGVPHFGVSFKDPVMKAKLTVQDVTDPGRKFIVYDAEFNLRGVDGPMSQSIGSKILPEGLVPIGGSQTIFKPFCSEVNDPRSYQVDILADMGTPSEVSGHLKIQAGLFDINERVHAPSQCAGGNAAMLANSRDPNSAGLFGPIQKIGDRLTTYNPQDSAQTGGAPSAAQGAGGVASPVGMPNMAPSSVIVSHQAIPSSAVQGMGTGITPSVFAMKSNTLQSHSLSVKTSSFGPKGHEITSFPGNAGCKDMSAVPKCLKDPKCCHRAPSVLVYRPDQIMQFL